MDDHLYDGAGMAEEKAGDGDAEGEGTEEEGGVDGVDAGCRNGVSGYTANSFQPPA